MGGLHLLPGFTSTIAGSDLVREQFDRNAVPDSFETDDHVLDAGRLKGVDPQNVIFDRAGIDPGFAKASALAVRSCSLSPTMPRDWSDDTTCSGRKCSTAHQLFPDAEAPRPA